MGLVIKKKGTGEVLKTITAPSTPAPEVPESTSMLDDIKATDAMPDPVGVADALDVDPIQQAQDLPWDDQVQGEVPKTKDNCIVTALAHLAAHHDGTLMLIRIASGEPFKVMNHNPEDGKTRLQDTTTERVFDVRITDRENRFYKPMWR